MTPSAAVQYVCMFLSAGSPGTSKDIQVKVAAARKVFRILRVRFLLLRRPVTVPVDPFTTSVASILRHQ
jgi:hypothetical protein